MKILTFIFSISFLFGYTASDSKIGLCQGRSSKFVFGTSAHCQRQGTSENANFETNLTQAETIFQSRAVYNYELSIGAIFQNEAPYLKEWIEFHKLVGVEHFYLYDNGSSDDYMAVLQPYIEKGEVECFEWPYLANSWENWLYEVQASCYRSCIQRAAQKTKWLALIDIDEFLTPVAAEKIPDVLKEYEPFAGVCFNWKIFGHSGFFDLPEDRLLIESLVMCAPHERSTHLGTKSIVRPEYVEDCQHPHYVVYKDGYYHVNSNKERAIDEDGSSNQIYHDRLVINHYWSRNGRYLYNKLKRYQPWFPEIVPELWEKYVEGMNEVRDQTMKRFIAPLRKKMFRKENHLDAFLRSKGFDLIPAGTQTVEGYVTPKQKQMFIEALHQLDSIHHIAEIGFNAGHTAETFLETKKDCHLVSFDINSHHYTKTGVQFIQEKYKGRFQFIEGDSQLTVPQYFRQNQKKKFDLIYIDGCHLFSACMNDIIHFKNLAHKDSVLWVDDYNFSDVKKAVDLAERLRIIKIDHVQSAQDASGIRVWVEARYVFE